MATKAGGEVSFSGTLEKGLAVPAFFGRPVAAVSVAGPDGRVSPRTGELGRLVCETGAALSRRLGSAGTRDVSRTS